MIENIKLLRNLGKFDSDSAAASLSLKPLTLIYAENGRGKTTLAAVMRSLATGNSQPIDERRRLGSSHPPHVVLRCNGESADRQFQARTWSKSMPEMKVFDDAFVDENVCSGLNVDAQHRRKLHELILGERGVALNRDHEELVSRVERHNAELETKAKAIPQLELNGLEINEFCDLPEQPDIDQKIEAAQRELKAARNSAEVRSAPLFETIELPGFDIEAIGQILQKDLPSLEMAAEAQVQEHVQALGEGGESWVEEGFRLVRESDKEDCPFCGQGIVGLDLVAHFRAYFSEEYSQLKQKVADIADSTGPSLAVSAQLAFERSVGNAKDSRHFWKDFVPLPRIEIDTEAAVSKWEAARGKVNELLEAKLSAPLERFELDNHALDTLEAYERYRQTIRRISEDLSDSNEDIRAVKSRAEVADTEQIQTGLNRLYATKARHSVEIAPLCLSYIQERASKNDTINARNEVRKALEEYREEVFPVMQEGVNEYLRDFNAGFRVDSLEPTNTGGGTGSSCRFSLVINHVPVSISSTNVSQEKPSFRNTISAGDRTTLALALFFSSLDQVPDLENTVVVIDDPTSSLDDHRSIATAQAVRYLSRRARQVIVLSHNRGFLYEVWKEADHSKCSSLEIAQDGDNSTLDSWQVSDAGYNGHDTRHRLLQEYADNQSGDPVTVAQAIRTYLEDYLRVAYPLEFPLDISLDLSLTSAIAGSTSKIRS